jgi:hypothetical protein
MEMTLEKIDKPNPDLYVSVTIVVLFSIVCIQPLSPTPLLSSPLLSSPLLSTCISQGAKLIARSTDCLNSPGCFWKYVDT